MTWRSARKTASKASRDDVEHEIEIKTAALAHFEEEGRRRDEVVAGTDESPRVSVVTPRSSLKIKVPTAPRPRIRNLEEAARSVTENHPGIRTTRN